MKPSPITQTVTIKFEYENADLLQQLIKGAQLIKAEHLAEKAFRGQRLAERIRHRPRDSGDELPRWLTKALEQYDHLPVGETEWDQSTKETP